MTEWVACCVLQMHGIATLEHLLRASDLMAPPLTGPQFANGVRWAAFPVFTEAGASARLLGAGGELSPSAPLLA